MLIRSASEGVFVKMHAGIRKVVDIEELAPRRAGALTSDG